MKYLDECHNALAYLVACDVVLREHIDSVFDFKEDAIKPDTFNDEWQTGTSKNTTRLAFNLWNGYTDGTSDYSPVWLFCNDAYVPYYWAAVQIRFNRYEE